jgi:hypothetical protein
MPSPTPCARWPTPTTSVQRHRPKTHHLQPQQAHEVDDVLFVAYRACVPRAVSPVTPFPRSPAQRYTLVSTRSQVSTSKPPRPTPACPHTLLAASRSLLRLSVAITRPRRHGTCISTPVLLKVLIGPNTIAVSLPRRHSLTSFLRIALSITTAPSCISTNLRTLFSAGLPAILTSILIP